MAHKGSVHLSREHLARTGRYSQCLDEDTFMFPHVYGLILISWNTNTGQDITVALDGCRSFEKLRRAALESEDIWFKTQFHSLLAGWPGPITQHLEISFSSEREWKYYCIHLPRWQKESDKIMYGHVSGTEQVFSRRQVIVCSPGKA